jgi:hypothetical protein
MANWSNTLGGPVILPSGSSAGHTHVATDITSSVLSTARLGSGTPSSANYLRGDGTWTAAPVTSVNSSTGAVTITAAGIGASATGHTHAASDITSGTIATARLGSGTANSTTYLRGDQTWATVSAGGGDTNFTPVVSDVENTTTPTQFLRFNITAGTWAIGEVIDVFFWYTVANFTGANQTLTHEILQGGSVIFNSTSTATLNNGTLGSHFGVFRLWRGDVNYMYATRANINTVMPPLFGPSLTTIYAGADTGGSGWSAATPNFSNIISVGYRLTLPVANPSLYVRMLNVRVVKYGGQAT